MRFKRTLALDSDGDLLLDETKQLGWRTGVEGVEQELRTLLKTVAGEDPLDENHGLDVFTAAGAPPAVFRRELRAALLRDDRVANVGDIDIDREEGTRRVDVSVEVRLVNGDAVELEAEV